MQNILFIVNGYPRAGKDTFVDICGGMIAAKGHHASASSSIDLIKSVTDFLGISEEPKTPEKRALWSDLKASLEKYNRFASRRTVQGILETMSKSKPKIRVGFVHVREPDAIDFMKTIARDCEVFTIFVDRDDAERVTSNASDMEVENYDYDVIIRNHGTLENLENLAEAFVMNTMLFCLSKGKRDAIIGDYE